MKMTPLSKVAQWGAVLVGMQLRFGRLLLELLVAKKIMEASEAQMLLYGHAEELRAAADRTGFQTLAYCVAQQIESLADEIASLNGP